MMQILVVLKILSLLMVPVFVNYKIPAPREDAEADSDIFEIALI